MSCASQPSGVDLHRRGAEGVGGRPSRGLLLAPRIDTRANERVCSAFARPLSAPDAPLGLMACGGVRFRGPHSALVSTRSHCSRTHSNSLLARGSGVVSPQKWCVFSSNIFRLIQTYSHIIHVDSLIRKRTYSKCYSLLFELLFVLFACSRISVNKLRITTNMWRRI